MAQNQNNNPGDQKDDPRQALEEGDPKMTGRTRGHPVDEQGEEIAGGRTDPDASQKQGKKDVSATTPHRESGDR
jgi:hypothetical protein